MATIERVEFNDYKTEQTNISDPVGTYETNERNDVMLVQTLFKIIGFSDTRAKTHFGLSTKDLPEPKGFFDLKTMKAIWGFQRKRANRLLNIDGKIHPGSYQNRVLKRDPTARQMMITLLNIDAQDAAVMVYNLDLISAIKKISPTIVFS